jgi:hypothetical protein
MSEITATFVQGPEGTNEIFGDCPYQRFGTYTFAAPGQLTISMLAGLPCFFGSGNNCVVALSGSVTVVSGNYSVCTKVEAEAGIVSGGTSVQDFAGASGGKVVGSFAFPGTHTLTFNGAATGIRLNMFSNGGATRTVTVDGVTQTGGLYNTSGTVTIDLLSFLGSSYRLSTGNQHSIKFEVPAVESGGMGLDYVEFCR